MTSALHALLARNKYIRSFGRLAKGHIPVYLEYAIEFRRRWGDETGHPELAQIISSAADRMQNNMAELAKLRPVVEAINAGTYPDLKAINWKNHMIPAFDALTLMWAGQRAERTYMEVGSGNSTLFVKAALNHAGNQTGKKTKIISIDPQPRAEVDAICDEVIRRNVEAVDLTVFDQLQAGDTLFIDNSHRSFMNSDVTVCMLEIIPRLKPGVLVGIHDICLPFDYIANWSDRGYNEQYLLASYLLANPHYFSIQFANYWITHHQHHHQPLADIWGILGEPIRDRLSSAFWMIKA